MKDPLNSKTNSCFFYAVSQGKVLQLMERISFEMKGDLKLAVRNPPTGLCHVPSTGASPPIPFLFLSPPSSISWTELLDCTTLYELVVGLM